MNNILLREHISKNNIEELKKINKDDLSTEDIKFLITTSVFYSNIEVLKLLKSKGIDLHLEEEEALTLSIELARPFELIKFLINDGANLLINDKKIFMKAAISDNLKVVKLIYEKYPDDEIFLSYGGNKVQKWMKKILLEKLNATLNQELPEKAKIAKNKI